VAADETVYSAAPLLASPRTFAADARADLRVVPAAAWRMWLRGLQARHRQSRLGYAWAVAPALAIALTWVYLDHVRIVRFGDVGIPYLAYAVAGVLLWQTFSDALHAPLRRLGGARDLLNKTRLPHEAWVLAGALEVAFDLLLRLAVLAVVLVAAGAPVGAALALAPLGLVVLLLLGLAIGLALVPLGLLYEDVGKALTLLTSFWFFLTPVVYPWPSDLPGTWLVSLNPVTPVLVTTRAWITGAPGAEPAQLAGVGIAAAALLFAAWIVYRLARPHLVARL
jgi:lipopolysaccharide transport system permease protein